MSSSHLEFEDRVQKLLRKHRAMTRGYKTRMRPDGLIEVKPNGRGAPISGRSVLIFLVAFLLFKGVLIASLGIDTYAERVSELRAGNLIEKAGGIAMQIEPVSELIAVNIQPLLH